jgi:tetratricopeptide (TPR) repeat protein
MKPFHPNTDRRKQALLLCEQGKFTQARIILLELEHTQELDADACFLTGSVLGQLGEYEEAAGYFQRAINITPDRPQAYIGRAKALISLGRIAEAESCYERLIERQSSPVQYIVQLATMLSGQGYYDAAEKRYLQALGLDTGSQEALSGLGRLYQATNRPELAKNYYNKLLMINPRSSNGHCMLGTLLYNQGQVEEAEKCFNKALELDEKHLPSCQNLGYLHLAMNRVSKARELFQHARALDPRNPDIIAALARLEDQSGNIQEAYHLVDPFIQQNILHAETGMVYADICRHFDCCHEAVDYLERILAGPGNLPRVKEKLHFTLGKLYDRLGEYDEAFSHFDQGNQMRPDTFNRIEDAACIEELIKTCGPNYFMASPRSSQTTRRPVFIVGMPRSGTTLTEQILSSHPDVQGLGELLVFPNIIRHLHSYLGAGTAYPGNLKYLTPAVLDSMAAAYLEAIGKLGPTDTLRVTDKTLVNFLYLGLISQMFPKVRIIHCMRDPRDTCLSIYFQNFDESHYYANRLENIGIYYNLYHRVMRHWKSLLDIPILEIQYEELVKDQEKISRRLIEFVGLEWDDRVLRFHESERSVVTASYDQVRQKIYTGSTARWKNYEKHLTPLLEALDFP